ncbi:50S ribosomal protein L35 [Mechercharimyces sp. CAU 1602]|uniref:50S ribosomal protein L35 n=1 Tax=Mechercharimyces sp. CAU 1602 TaxID=2973933 RepID=UPI00216181DD|nr:50S ribosomal protein L35 [Mechercharimyces sp. CAU 1602]MCS1351569.1 50S ribosomal protein L35 [Mechercharimyces sp. CAU 1602]
MPKMKTRRSVAKRFKKTGTGKIKRSHAFMNHMQINKPKSAKRKLRKSALLSKGDTKRIAQQITYMK